MHKNCRVLVEQALKKIEMKDKTVIDIGSLDVNGTLKEFFPESSYTGLDIVPGDNVDIVSEELYNYPVEAGSYDIVISSNTGEHIEDIFRWVKELARVAKEYVVLCLPTAGAGFHRHPIDCWRVYPDGMKYLLKQAGLEVIYCKMEKTDSMTDVIAIGKKYASVSNTREKAVLPKE